MLREEFDSLIQKIEKRYERRPGALKWRVIRYAILGYCVNASELVGYSLLIPGIVILYANVADFTSIWPAVIVGAGGFCGMFFGTLLVQRFRFKTPPQKGFELTPKEFPQFFARLEALSRQQDAGRFDHVWLTVDCNAGVLETGFLFLGNSKKHLRIGLPLMEVLSDKELFAVLAHEVAHLSARHSRLSGWLYRLRKSWERSMQVSSQRQRRFSIASFWGRFWPIFNAYAFVLARQHEYQADHAAAEAFGGDTLASALARTNIAFEVGQRFWDEHWNRAQTESIPPQHTIEDLCAVLNGPVAPDDFRRWVAEMLSRETDNTDTHPAYTYRVQKLRSSFSPHRLEVPLAGPSAAQAILQQRQAEIREAVQKAWTKDASENWKLRFDRNQSLAARLKDIDSAAALKTMDADLAWERAQVVIQLHGLTPAESLLRHTLTLRPNNSQANYALGCLLLQNGDSSGERYLQTCMEQDNDYTVGCLEAMLQSAIQKGDRARVRDVRRSLDQFEKNRVKANREMLSVNWTNSFSSHELPQEILSGLKSTVSAIPQVRSIRLGRKVMKYGKEKVYVLVLSASGGNYRKLIDDVSYRLSLPGRFLIIRSGDERIIELKLRMIPNTLVFSKR